MSYQDNNMWPNRWEYSHPAFSPNVFLVGGKSSGKTSWLRHDMQTHDAESICVVGNQAEYPEITHWLTHESSHNPLDYRYLLPDKEIAEAKTLHIGNLSEILTFLVFPEFKGEIDRQWQGYPQRTFQWVFNTSLHAIYEKSGDHIPLWMDFVNIAVEQAQKHLLDEMLDLFITALDATRYSSLFTGAEGNWPTERKTGWDFSNVHPNLVPCLLGMYLGALIYTIQDPQIIYLDDNTEALSHHRGLLHYLDTYTSQARMYQKSFTIAVPDVRHFFERVEFGTLPAHRIVGQCKYEIYLRPDTEDGYEALMDHCQAFLGSWKDTFASLKPGEGYVKMGSNWEYSNLTQTGLLITTDRKTKQTGFLL